MSIKSKIRATEIRKSIALLGVYAALSAWGTYSVFTSWELKPGVVFFGCVLGGGAIWSGSLFALALVAVARSRKGLNNPPR